MNRYRSQSGMTLVELMIALALGLVVIGGALGLIVSMMRSNNDTIRAARLTQELRAMADIATMEIRRARSLTDPLANVGVGATAFTSCNAITTPNSACLVFAYNCNAVDGKGQFRSIRLDDPKLVVAQGVDAAQSCSASGADVELNSDELEIDLVNFSVAATGAVSFSFQGHLSTDATMSRTVTRVVWPRSAPVVP